MASKVVYYPKDNEFERNLQDASYKHEGRWLSQDDCQLMSRAIVYLKMSNPLWTTTSPRERAAYFFSPYLTSQKDVMVFVTYPLFVRDILENNEFNSYLHSPVVFMTRPLAHYLFREYTIHLHIDKDKLLSLNSGVEFVLAGGLLMSNENVAIDKSCIAGMITSENRNRTVDMSESTLDEVKLAASLVAPGVFQIDEHERALLPDMDVWDKDNRTKGVISNIEPGETGNVEVNYEDGHNTIISKQFFDQRFVVV